MRIILLFLALMHLNTYCQAQSPPKKILYIISATSFKPCSLIALKIQDDKVAIDGCYGANLKQMSTAYKVELKQLKVLKKLYKTSTADLKATAQAIDATNCDYGFPIQLIVLENGKQETIEWKRVDGCYPKEIRKIMKQLEPIFIDNTTRIIHHE